MQRSASRKWGQVSKDAGAWGFDEYLTYLDEKSPRYWAPRVGISNKRPESGLRATEYLPDIQHKYMLDFIDRHKDGPFFVYYPMVLIHFAAATHPGQQTRFQAGRPGAQNYRDYTDYMDKLVGQLVKELEQRGMLENTVIIYTGDNGAQRNFIQMETIDGRHIAGARRR